MFPNRAEESRRTCTKADPSSRPPDAGSAPAGPNGQPPGSVQGTVWLVYDAARDRYHCYWLVGPADDHLLEHAEAPSAALAVEWARSHTPRARIRLPDHRTYWAGTDPAPGGFAGTWTAASPTTTPLPRHVSPKTRLPRHSPRRPDSRPRITI